MTDNLGIYRFAGGLETAHQQSTRIVADIQVAVVIGQGRQVTLDTVDRVGQQVEMLARPDWNFDGRKHGVFAAPQSGAECDRVAANLTSAGFDADNFIIAGFYRGKLGVLENFCAASARSLDECRA